MEITYSKELLQRAERGEAEAQYLLAMCYYGAHGIARIYSKAKYWCEKAAEQGYVRAFMQLGFMYDNGHGVPVKKHEIAFKYYLKAAEKDNATACNNVATSYLIGEGTEQNLEMALEWFVKAANNGSARAVCMLGDFARRGYVGEPDPEKALKMFRLAAEANDSLALFRLGECYANGECGLKQSLSEAADFYKRAFERGDIDACVRLGDIYAEGRGDVSRDTAKAKYYYKIAATDYGNQEAMEKLRRL